MTQVDIAVVGGGLVGASLAIALAPGGKKIALIEAAAPPKSLPSWDEREIALNVVSRRIYAGLGLWQRLAPEATPILATHISERGRFGVARFTAEEAGEDALGWNVPVRALGAVLWQKLGELKNVELICPAKVDGLEQGANDVRLRVIPAQGNLACKLTVACDGAQSAIRKALNIGARETDYGQVAIVTAVRPERPHKGVAYERFLPGGPIAIIPKPDGRCGVIWTVPASEAPKMLAWSDGEFLAQLQDGFGMRLGRFLEAGGRNGHPLTRVLSDALTAPRTIFAGNAAQTLHPIAAQGFNLGLRDVATVAELVGAAEDPGAPSVLAEYEARRSKERERVSDFTDGLVRIFSNSIAGLADARHWGLLALDLLPPVRRAFMGQNRGSAGGTPKVARK
ncbi:MAG: 2-octaprenyl-6-methoxyphenyl hydroxylase [Gammaproteobacteria bacterium]